MGKSKKAIAQVLKSAPKANGKAAPLKSKPVDSSSSDDSDEEPVVKSQLGSKSITPSIKSTAAKVSKLGKTVPAKQDSDSSSEDDEPPAKKATGPRKTAPPANPSSDDSSSDEETVVKSSKFLLKAFILLFSVNLMLTLPP